MNRRPSIFNLNRLFTKKEVWKGSHEKKKENLEDQMETPRCMPRRPLPFPESALMTRTPSEWEFHPGHHRFHVDKEVGRNPALHFSRSWLLQQGWSSLP